jgi:Lipid A 3-O-deacylase (PagL)
MQRDYDSVRMVSRTVLSFMLGSLMVLGAASRSAAQDAFGEGAIGVEFGGAGMGELWNLNDRREWLADASAAVWWNFTRRASLVVEFHATRIWQTPSRDAFVNGFLPALRWRLIERPSAYVFVEAGPGISWSDTRTPPRGTQFNYLIEGSVGWTRRLGPRTQFVTSARLLHISNKGREGREHNPDIEAIGGYAGLAIAF